MLAHVETAEFLLAGDPKPMVYLMPGRRSAPDRTPTRTRDTPRSLHTYLMQTSTDEEPPVDGQQTTANLPQAPHTPCTLDGATGSSTFTTESKKRTAQHHEDTGHSAMAMAPAPDTE